MNRLASLLSVFAIAAAVALPVSAEDSEPAQPDRIRPYTQDFVQYKDLPALWNKYADNWQDMPAVWKKEYMDKWTRKPAPHQ